MTFFLPPGEHVRKELRLELGGGLLSALPFMARASQTIHITNRRLVVTESSTRGNEATTHVPLEEIIQVRRGQYSSKRSLYAAIALLVLALIAGRGVAFWGRYYIRVALDRGVLDFIDPGTLFRILEVIAFGAGTVLLGIAGAIMLMLYFGNSAESVIVEARKQRPIILSTGRQGVSHIEDLDGNLLSWDELDNLHEELEAARQVAVHKGAEAGDRPARPV